MTVFVTDSKKLQKLSEVSIILILYRIKNDTERWGYSMGFLRILIIFFTLSALNSPSWALPFSNDIKKTTPSSSSKTNPKKQNIKKNKNKNENFNKIKKQKPSRSKTNRIYLEENAPDLIYFYNIGRQNYNDFKKEINKTRLVNVDLDLLFLKYKKQHQQKFLNQSDLSHYLFYDLTKSVSLYLTELKDNYSRLSQNDDIRNQLQLAGYGLSLAIKKANNLNLNINSDQFSKLYDLLLSQSTPLFYSSENTLNMKDIFWKSFFLSQLSYPIDLVSEHFTHLDDVLSHFPPDVFFELYKSQLAKYALIHSVSIKKFTLDDLNKIFSYAQIQAFNSEEYAQMQKSYYKNLLIVGDSATLRTYKKKLAANILSIEGKNLFNDFSYGNAVKYVQILIGYIFVAWPLEWILILIALLIFFIQSKTVIVDEDQKKENLVKKLWIMFTRSYLGANVPFFSKLAASFVLFGIGLYFNSARAFLESLIN